MDSVCIYENKCGKGYKNSIVCPHCGYAIKGLNDVLDFIDEEIIYETEYDEYRCPECDKEFDFNVEYMERGEIIDKDNNTFEILSIETYVWDSESFNK